MREVSEASEASRRVKDVVLMFSRSSVEKGEVRESL
jgi:hypothetical protein